jgi:hypothetical protein
MAAAAAVLGAAKFDDDVRRAALTTSGHDVGCWGRGEEEEAFSVGYGVRYGTATLYIGIIIIYTSVRVRPPNLSHPPSPHRRGPGFLL